MSAEDSTSSHVESVASEPAAEHAADLTIEDLSVPDKVEANGSSSPKEAELATPVPIPAGKQLKPINTMAAKPGAPKPNGPGTPLVKRVSLFLHQITR